MGGSEGGGRCVGGEDGCQEQAGCVPGLGPELGLGGERGSCAEMGVAGAGLGAHVGVCSSRLRPARARALAATSPVVLSISIILMMIV